MIDGITGNVKFDTDGRRTNFQIYIYDLTFHGYVQTGSWNPSDGVSVSAFSQPSMSGIDNESLFNRTFIVLTVLVSFWRSKILISENLKKLFTESAVWHA